MGEGEGGHSVGGVVGRLRRTVVFPEVGRRQVCGEGSAVEEVVVVWSEERLCSIANNYC